MNDERWMARVLSLARRGSPHASPNPLVGALLVEDGEIIGEGWHRSHGGLHAERAAILDARTRTGRTVFPRATLYCNLEPCSHRGPQRHQPPCTDIIMEAEIARVVIAHLDPYPQVNGQGVQTLKAAGIQVSEGLAEAEARKINRGYLSRITRGRPRVTLKLAQSLDGCIAAADGSSKWISSPSSRALVQRMRAESDAILVGRGTWQADDPSLTVRSSLPDAAGIEATANPAANPAPRQPLRVLLDSRAQLDPSSRLAAPGTLLFCGSAAAPGSLARLEQAGVEISRDPVNIRPRLEDVLTILGGRGINYLLVEGGAELASGLLKARLWDRLELFIAPKLLGKGKSWTAGLEIGSMSEAMSLGRPFYRQLEGGDILVSIEREEEACLQD